MRPVFRLGATLSALLLCLLAGCKKSSDKPFVDQPRLASGVTLHDVTFRSVALNRDMQYRVVLPANLAGGTRLPVVYLLHGGGGDFRDWTNNSDVAGFAERGLVLVMPQGDAAYFTNSVSRPQDRYEDYIVKDVLQDVESKFPVLQNREGRAIVGISLGGLAAVRFSFKHPELYQFAAGISPAIDVPRRGFSVRRPGQWLSYRSAFGLLGSDARNHDDPFLLAKTAEPVEVPYLFLTCGDKEGLLSPNREFDAVLTRRHIAHEFHVGPGGHDWNQWNGWLGPCFESLQKYIGHAHLEQR